MHKLPDGSGFFVASLPLPETHWLYEPNPEPAMLGHFREVPSAYPAIVAAARYAIRGATMSGREMDFDPDALVLNLLYALLGPYQQELKPFVEREHGKP